MPQGFSPLPTLVGHNLPSLPSSFPVTVTPSGFYGRGDLTTVSCLGHCHHSFSSQEVAAGVLACPIRKSDICPQRCASYGVNIHHSVARCTEFRSSDHLELLVLLISSATTGQGRNWVTVLHLHPVFEQFWFSQYSNYHAVVTQKFLA